VRRETDLDMELADPAFFLARRLQFGAAHDMAIPTFVGEEEPLADTPG
jgi:hypothetical protein